ncbi:MAG: hypothetical protein P857_1003 [Candidatus Xenolissoclinum pacificiensis L6]|uniref:ATP synthase F1 complex delta/epsilon subunit N-terminal domain-containing protein n=1 Tax=Candidatus Xenolissoclinum pacificiensis L6 TaxID=1401685 RepID=W2V152_9RICK|nr:MAG: hypothetical protein P857_1003 [Candidatus Xenolissoclinum pacificiensis L6]
MSIFFQIECVSKNGIVFSGKIKSFTARAKGLGVFTVLSGHDNYTFCIEPCIIKIVDDNEQVHYIQIVSDEVLFHVDHITRDKCELVADNMFLCD